MSDGLTPPNLGKEVRRVPLQDGGAVIVYSSGWRLVISPALIGPTWSKPKPEEGTTDEA